MTFASTLILPPAGTRVGPPLVIAALFLVDWWLSRRPV